MNWTGGGLSRSKISRGASTALQKQHFAKIRSKQRDGLTKHTPTSPAQFHGSESAGLQQTELRHRNKSDSQDYMSKVSEHDRKVNHHILEDDLDVEDVLPFMTPQGSTKRGRHFSTLPQDSVIHSNKSISVPEYSKSHSKQNSYSSSARNNAVQDISLTKSRHNGGSFEVSNIGWRTAGEGLNSQDTERAKRLQLLQKRDWTRTEVLQPLKVQEIVPSSDGRHGKRRRVSNNQHQHIVPNSNRVDILKRPQNIHKNVKITIGRKQVRGDKSSSSGGRSSILKSESSSYGHHVSPDPVVKLVSLRERLFIESPPARKPLADGTSVSDLKVLDEQDLVTSHQFVEDWCELTDTHSEAGSFFGVPTSLATGLNSPSAASSSPGQDYSLVSLCSSNPNRSSPARSSEKLGPLSAAAALIRRSEHNLSLAGSYHFQTNFRAPSVLNRASMKYDSEKESRTTIQSSRTTYDIETATRICGHHPSSLAFERNMANRLLKVKPPVSSAFYVPTGTTHFTQPPSLGESEPVSKRTLFHEVQTTSDPYPVWANFPSARSFSTDQNVTPEIVSVAATPSQPDTSLPWVGYPSARPMIRNQQKRTIDQGFFAGINPAVSSYGYVTTRTQLNDVVTAKTKTAAPSKLFEGLVRQKSDKRGPTSYTIAEDHIYVKPVAFATSQSLTQNRDIINLNPQKEVSTPTRSLIVTSSPVDLNCTLTASSHGDLNLFTIARPLIAETSLISASSNDTSHYGVVLSSSTNLDPSTSLSSIVFSINTGPSVIKSRPDNANCNQDLNRQVGTLHVASAPQVRTMFSNETEFHDSKTGNASSRSMRQINFHRYMSYLVDSNLPRVNTFLKDANGHDFSFESDLSRRIHQNSSKRHRFPTQGLDTKETAPPLLELEPTTLSMTSSPIEIEFKRIGFDFDGSRRILSPRLAFSPIGFVSQVVVTPCLAQSDGYDSSLENDSSHRMRQLFSTTLIGSPAAPFSATTAPYLTETRYCDSLFNNDSSLGTPEVHGTAFTPCLNDTVAAIASSSLRFTPTRDLSRWILSKVVSSPVQLVPFKDVSRARTKNTNTASKRMSSVQEVQAGKHKKVDLSFEEQRWSATNLYHQQRKWRDPRIYLTEGSDMSMLTQDQRDRIVWCPADSKDLNSPRSTRRSSKRTKLSNIGPTSTSLNSSTQIPSVSSGPGYQVQQKKAFQSARFSNFIRSQFQINADLKATNAQGNEIAPTPLFTIRSQPPLRSPRPRSGSDEKKMGELLRKM